MGDALIVILLVLVLIALVAVGVLLAKRAKGANTSPPEQAPVDPFGSGDVDAVRGDPRQLKPGAIVEIRGVSYGVRGSLRLSEGSWKWDEHFLETADGRRTWLSVEEDPELELVLYTELPGVNVQPGKTVELDGRTFVRDETGEARFRAEGTTGLNPEGSVRYEDYASKDDVRLALEDFGAGKWEVSRGEVLSRHEVMIYPAAG